MCAKCEPTSAGAVPRPKAATDWGRASDRGLRPGLEPPAQVSSVSRAFASMAASDLRTWLRSVVNQKSGSDAFR